jgi:metal-responsive CopG/Arc/MetJ family transcriptional regulator
MKNKKIQFSISIDKSIAERVEEECAKTGANRSECIGELLDRALSEYQPSDYDGIIYR